VSLRVGSIGYERFADSRDFAATLATAGFERLIDVRELANSRRRGYSKTALSGVLAEAAIEYLHVRALGNPKPIRDLYKAGRVAEGRELYRRRLPREALERLADALREKPTALMCLEDDPSSCHRTDILAALRDELGLELEVVEL
jgi:uncharacterized protein (DUF488 family)